MPQNRRPDFNPHSAAIHVGAQRRVLRHRRLRNHSREVFKGKTLPYKVLESTEEYSFFIFERICLESCLYHSTIIMLQGTSLPESDISDLYAAFRDHLSSSTLPVNENCRNWPIIGMPYSVFSLVTNTAQLANRVPYQDQVDYQKGLCIYDEVLKWENNNALQNSGAGSSVNDFKHQHTIAQRSALLYAKTTRLLLLRVLRGAFAQSLNVDLCATSIFRQSMDIISSLDIPRSQFSSFFIWPLIVLMQCAQTETDMNVLQIKFFAARATSAAVVCMADGIMAHLEKVWKYTAAREISIKS